MPLPKFLFHQESDFRPDRAWRFLLGGFLILAIIIFAAAAYLYRILNTLEVVSQEKMTITSAARLDEKAIRQVVMMLGEKKAKFETLLITPPAIVDPSR